jgi:hypothetical protein
MSLSVDAFRTYAHTTVTTETVRTHTLLWSIQKASIAFHRERQSPQYTHIVQHYLSNPYLI